MRLARFAPLALALLPATAASQGSESPLTAAPQGASQPRAGQYRTVLELVAFEVPGAPEDDVRLLREAFVEGLAPGNDFCFKPALGDAADRSMLEQIAEGECTFARFARTGAAVSAAMSCSRSESIANRVTVDGGIWAENADVAMALEQDLGWGPTRITVRARAARVGDC